MSLGDRVDDWQVCGLMQVGAGDGVAAGLFVFDFYSAKMGGTARFTFKGAGVGLGGDASGTLVPEQVGPFGPWSSIDCDQPFSVWDLNGAWGRLTTAGVGLGLTVGVVFITAAPPWSMFHSYFHSQNVGGLGVGAGAGALVLLGNWRFKKVSNNRPSAPADDTAAA